ncbi:uncharacterized protein LY89DRAFT_238950 [Mollisia scopiformis]|uniref:F-box domain-containing protein n=1 Tax=Mollisia scopiformis TaxID=149040 RepID=A0A194WU89_MOLSC|nr:uncharacterized protein LY89DRAFT_238950 [Mollisia scopiformis]KUJ11172.1 hypothetical protein LY89DRAFT_238950 [Mollisia scopiformis]
MSATPTPRAYQLPPELWAYICEDLSRKDLRNLRLVCRYLQDCTAPALFKTVFLKVSLDSFANLQKISEHPVFSRSVRYIYYDGRILAPFLLNCEFQDWRQNYLDARMYARYNAFGSKQRHNVYLAFINHTSGQEYIRKGTHEKEMLSQYLSRLPGLCGIFVQSSEYNSLCPGAFTKPTNSTNPILLKTFTEPEFYRQQNDEYFWSLFEAATSNPQLSELSGVGLDIRQWTLRANLSMELSQRVPNIRRLKLEFSGQPKDFSSFERVLIRLPSLESLRISFTYIDSSEYLEAPVRSNLLNEQMHWKRLRHLSLQAIPTGSQHLKTFLAKHSNSLRSLELGDIIFVPDPENPDAKDATWIDFILFLCDELTLNNVKFSGTLYAGRNEKWTIPESPFQYHMPFHPGNLRFRIEQYITHNSYACPFTSIEHRGKDSSGNGGFLESHSSRWKWTPDASWVLTLGSRIHVPNSPWEASAELLGSI